MRVTDLEPMGLWAINTTSLLIVDCVGIPDNLPVSSFKIIPVGREPVKTWNTQLPPVYCLKALNEISLWIVNVELLYEYDEGAIRDNEVILDVPEERVYSWYDPPWTETVHLEPLLQPEETILVDWIVCSPFSIQRFQEYNASW